MATDWQAKAEAFTGAVRDVEAMVAAAEARPDLTHADALRLSHSTGRIVEAVDGLLSRLQPNGADPSFLRTLDALLEPLRSADARATRLVTQASGPLDGAARESVGDPEPSPPVRAPRRPWFPGRLGDFPGKLSVVGDGAYSLDVVVEPFDRDALDALFGPSTDAGAGQETFCSGELLPEDRNLYDANAIALYVSGLKVGHLSRDHARLFREAAAQARIAGQSVDVDVLVTKGWRRKRGDESPWRVRIDASAPFAFGPRQRDTRTAGHQ